MNATTNEFLLTSEGIETLKAELHELTMIKRPELAQRLKEAKEEGDLSENSAWDAARDDQGMTEGRIAEIEHILKHAKLIEAKKTGGVVGLGSKVHVELANGKQQYTIVGSTEANPDLGRVSDVSPLGKALLGKKPGDKVEVQVPAGTLTYKIVHVE